MPSPSREVRIVLSEEASGLIAAMLGYLPQVLLRLPLLLFFCGIFPIELNDGALREERHDPRDT